MKPSNSPLTDREHVVAKYYASGLGRMQIADILKVSVKTVDTHRTNAMRKLQCGTNVQLVLRFIREGWLDVDLPGYVRITANDAALLRAVCSRPASVEAIDRALSIVGALESAAATDEVASEGWIDFVPRVPTEVEAHAWMAAAQQYDERGDSEAELRAAFEEWVAAGRKAVRATIAAGAYSEASAS